MTVDQHHTMDPPVPGGMRAEIVQGSLTLSTGTATETITCKFDYSSKPIVVGSAGNGATDEEVSLTVQDDDPTSNDDIVIRLDGSTDEEKEYHVAVLDLLGGD